MAEAIKLINYGGGEIIEAYHQTLEGGASEARLVMHKLADTLAKRGKRDRLCLFAWSH